MRLHLFTEAMTGLVPMVWAACGEPVRGNEATLRSEHVTCKGCKLVMERAANPVEVDS